MLRERAGLPADVSRGEPAANEEAERRVASAGHAEGGWGEAWFAAVYAALRKQLRSRTRRYPPSCGRRESRELKRGFIRGSY